MFVLPPPPKYGAGQNGLYATGPGGGPLLETNNTLQHPTGPEHQLVVGEGTYHLTDDIHLATPPPHPSDAPQPNNNPLATNIGPATAGVKLSLVALTPTRLPSPRLFRVQSLRSNVPHSIQEEAYSPRSDASSSANGFGSTSYHSGAVGFGDSNPALQAVAPLKGKKDQKLKPKNNIIKSNSSYVSRVLAHDSLPKKLSDRSADGLFAFANINRAFLWLDLSSDTKTENLTKILFTKGHVLCHDVNTFTKAAGHLDVIMGFNTSDIIWYEPFSQKYARLNKNGMINSAPIRSIAWIPGKENLFIAAHQDGTLVVYDKDKEDAVFVADDVTATNGLANGGQSLAFRIKKSVQSSSQKSNPVAAWKISNMKINAISFSPDGQSLAVVCEDGALTILDYVNERVIDVYRSYYGAMLCVTWSPDGRYVLTGGQDDLVSIWSLADQTLVARCVGHESWVTDVKFDPWRCDERNYRFGSVGDDCRLLLWDFSVGMLRRPNVRHRGSVSTHVSANRKESVVGAMRMRSNSSRTQPDGVEVDKDVEVVHAVDSKASAAVLPPVLSKSVDEHPLCWLGFEETQIMTSCKDGHVRIWERPSDTAGQSASRANSAI